MSNHLTPAITGLAITGRAITGVVNVGTVSTGTNHINHSQLDFFSGAGSASVNLYTGRLLFTRPDISVGANTFTFGVSHTYDTHSSAVMPQNSVMGNQWNISIQQHLAPNSNNPQQYFYYDGRGFTHVFEEFDRNASRVRYHDTTGLGLVLIDDRQNSWPQIFIEDTQGEQLVFDNQALTLRRIVSSQDGRVAKVIEYDAQGRPLSIFDSRKQSRSITFAYENNLLARMECHDGAQLRHRVSYQYSSGNLTRITDEGFSSAEPSAPARILHYRYNAQNRLRFAFDAQNGSALRVDYHADGRVMAVETGVTTHAEESGFVSNAHTAFAYDSTASALNGRINGTTVTNEKNIALDYFFNAQGFTTGVLERRNPANPTDLMTVTKDSGADSCARTFR